VAANVAAPGTQERSGELQHALTFASRIKTTRARRPEVACAVARELWLNVDHPALGVSVMEAKDGTATEQQNVWTVGDLAGYLRINRKSAYSLVEKGEVPGVRRVGRIIRISRAAVIRWLAGEGRASRSKGGSR
jgi:excisionase family DNA binding protein